MNGKKAGIDVSMNSIVVIVFALIMLGLGIGFINGLFGNIDVPIPKAEIHATPEQPIVLFKSTITLNRGTTAKIPITFYNNERAKVTSVSKPTLTACVNEEGQDSLGKFVMSGLGQEVEVGDEVIFEVTLKVGKDAPMGNNVCNLKVSETQKQFTIEIKK